MKVNYFKVFFEDFLTKHLKSLTDGNLNSVKKIKEFVKSEIKKIQVEKMAS